MMNTQKKTSNSHRLPSLYCKTLIKSEFDYRREIRRKLDRIQHDSHDMMRRHIASDHVFQHELLTKRHQWFSVDKSYRDTCRVMWNRQAAEQNQTRNVVLPSIYPIEKSTSTDPNTKTTENNQGESNEKIRHDFLSKQPVMLEIMYTPHASQFLKQKHHIALRKESAQRRHVNLQTAAINDHRYHKLVHSLQDV